MPPAEWDVPEPCIRTHYFKDGEYHPFMIAEFTEVAPWGPRDNYSIFQCFNHWPAGRMKNDGRWMNDSTRIGHACVGSGDFKVYRSDLDSQTPYVCKLKMEGLTNQPIAELVPLARSWLQAPAVKQLRGASDARYDKAQRAYIFEANSDEVSFTLAASNDSPVVNPCFVVKNWPSRTTKAALKVDGKSVQPGPGFRQGVIRDTDRTYTLVIWLRHNSTGPVQFEINR